jgi:uncharacterized protein YndB with AHSA1/START domain
MQPVVKHVLIQAPIERVWSALAVESDIAAWMQDDSAKIDLRPGGAYSFFGGSTTGVVTRVEAPHVLEYSWRQSEWPPSWGDSNVRWSLQSAGEVTLVRLTHDGFPNASERDSHDSGWDDYWLKPMLEWLEAASGTAASKGPGATS